jgi:hypothetical protein
MTNPQSIGPKKPSCPPPKRDTKGNVKPSGKAGNCTGDKVKVRWR